MQPKKFEQERSVFNFEVVSTSYNFYESCFSNLNLSLTSIIKITVLTLCSDDLI